VIQDLVFQQLINGFTIGMIYGTAALGFTMVYKALGYLNFAHADNLMIGALLAYTCIVTLKFPLFVSFLVVIVLMLLYGMCIERVLFRHFQRESKITFMLVSISLSGILKNAALLIWGPEPRALPAIWGTGAIILNGVPFPIRNIYIMLIAITCLALTSFFFAKTKIGLAMRIAADDPEAAGLMGVRVSWTRVGTFSITAALGAIAGVLVAPLFNITPELGSSLALKAFIAAVVGGVGHIPGALICGIFLGVGESLTAGFVSSGYRDAIIYAVGIMILAFKPTGIFQKAYTKH